MKHLGHLLGNDFRIGEHRHEVRVAIPSWHDMKMDMLVDSGAGRPANICADVETIRVGDFLERLHHALYERHDFSQFIFGKIDNRGDMAVGDDQQVSAVIREEIHDDKATLGAGNNQMLIILVVLRGIAQDAFGSRMLRLRKCLDILGPPGREEFIHVCEVRS